MNSNGKYIYMALSTKMSQLGHYETIHTHGNVHLESSSRADSPENDFIDNVQNNKKVIKIEIHILSNTLVDSFKLQGHILLHKLELRLDLTTGESP
jgi:hypothetical protein